MEENILGISAYLDISDVRQTAEEMIKTLEELAGKTATINSELKKFGDGTNIDELKTKLEEYVNITAETSKAAEAAYRQQQVYVEKLKEKLKELSEKQGKVGEDTENINELTKEYKKLEEELVKAEANVGVLQRATKNAADEYDNAVAALQRCEKAISQIDEASAQSSTKIGNLYKNLKEWATGHGKLGEGLDTFKKGLDKLPIPLKSATDGVGDMVKGMWAMCQTPIGRVLALVTFALQALFQWFTKNAEGQKKFAQITGYVSSILSSLGDIAIKVGEYLFNAFASSNGAMNAFAKGLVTTFKTAVTSAVNLITGLGKGVKGLYQILTGDFKDGWETLKSAGSDMGTAISSAIDTIGNAIKATGDMIKGTVKMAKDGISTLNNTDMMGYINKLNQKGKENAQLQLRQKENEIAISKAKEKEAEQDAKIAESREKIYTLSGKERLAEIERLKTLQKEKFDERIKQYQEAYDIQKRTNKLHSSTLEDEEKERQLNIQLLQLKAQQAAATRMTTRLEQSTIKTMVNEGKKNAKNNATMATAQAKLDELLYTQEQARIKAEEGMEKRIADARIEAMEEGYAKTKALRELQNKEELQTIQQQRDAALEIERKRQKAQYEAEQAVIKAKGGKAGVWDNSMFDNNDSAVIAVNRQYDELTENVRLKHARLEKDIIKQQVQSMRDYLKEYGNIQQKELAMTQDYAERIAEAKTPQEKASLEIQQDEELRRLRTDTLKDKIDWNGVFSDLEGHTAEYLRGLRDQLQLLIDSGEVTDITEIAEIQQKLYDINDAINEQGGMFNYANEQQREHIRLVKQAEDAQENLNKALAEQTNALASFNMIENTLKNFLKTQGLEGVDIDDNLLSQFEDGTPEFKKAQELITKYFKSLALLNKAQERTTKATKKNAEAQDAAEEKLDDKVARHLSNINDWVQKYLGDLPGLLNELGLGGSEEVQKGLNGINDAAGAAADFASGNYVGAAMKAISAVKNFGEAFGAWSNSNRAEVEAANKKLEIATNVNTEAINRLTEAMKTQNPEEAYRSYERALAAMQSNEQAARQTMLNNAYMYDGGHSLNYDLGYAGGVIRDIFKLLNKPINGDYDLGGLLSSLSAQDLASLYDTKEGTKLLERLGQAIAGAEDEGNYNGMFQDLLDYINNFNTKAYDELLMKFQESVTQVSFDSLYDNFVSSLMDMDKSAEDFANDFEGYLRSAIYNAMVGSVAKEALEKWYKAFASYVKSGNTLDKGEIEALMKTGGTFTYTDENGKERKETFESIASIRQSAEKMRDEIEALGLYNGQSSSSQQSASANGIENISYDQADSLVGIETAQQIVMEQSLQEQILQTGFQSSIAENMQRIQPAISDIKDNITIIAEAQTTMNNHLADISRFTSVLPDMQEDLYRLRKTVEEL